MKPELNLQPEQMLRKIYWTMLLLFLFFQPAFSQIDTLSLNSLFFRKCLKDSRSIITAPFHWKSKDWGRFGIITTAVASTCLIDQSVADFSQKYRSKELDHITAGLLEPFDFEYSFLLMGGFVSYGLLAKNQTSISTSLLLFESYALSMLFVRIPKNLIGRRRPDSWPPATAYDWEGPFHGVSFPSGHTTASFAVASVIANQYRDYKWVPITAYSVATLAGLSRIYDNRHWLSDVVAGAALGIVIGNLVSRKTSSSKLSVVPFRNGSFQGLKLAYKL